MLALADSSSAIRVAESADVLKAILPYIYPREATPFVLATPLSESFAV